MPWLLLDVSFDNEVEERSLGPGHYKIDPGPEENRVRMKLIDTDKGKVTELEYHFSGGDVTERDPTQVEVASAIRALNQDAMAEADRKIQTAKRAHDRRVEELLKNIEVRDEQIAKFESVGGNELQDLRGKVERQEKLISELTAAAKLGLGLTGNQQNMMSAAVAMLAEHYEDEGVDSGAEEARALYRRLTGVELV